MEGNALVVFQRGGGVLDHAQAGIQAVGGLEPAWDGQYLTAFDLVLGQTGEVHCQPHAGVA